LIISGGPDIAFRGGRVDAAVANSPGVPEPEQDLDSHIASFARQGFTPTEMIGLVACGYTHALLPLNDFRNSLVLLSHTFGGVQRDPFPNIVPEVNDANNTQSVLHFDTTNVHFDNNVCASSCDLKCLILICEKRH
jgi:hypothetical protein